MSKKSKKEQKRLAFEVNKVFKEETTFKDFQDLVKLLWCIHQNWKFFDNWGLGEVYLTFYRATHSSPIKPILELKVYPMLSKNFDISVLVVNGKYYMSSFGCEIISNSVDCDNFLNDFFLFVLLYEKFCS